VVTEGIRGFFRVCFGWFDDVARHGLKAASEVTSVISVSSVRAFPIFAFLRVSIRDPGSRKVRPYPGLLG
jgi:hypothetical protein